jgi:photosystem II stability/assembly factor-like uncharacterized protein
VLIGALLVAGSVSAAGGVLRQDALTWTRLGPPGPEPVRAVALSPRWPADRLLLVARQEDLARSDDGATWESLSSPGGLVRLLWLAPSRGERPVAFALASRQGWTVYRSSDVGSSWQSVQSLPESNEPPELVLSPALADDATAFLVANGDLLRSRDAGASWEPLAPAPGQSVQQVVLSPNFGQDRSVYAAATSGGFPPVLGDRPSDQPATEAADSAGVLRSADGGTSWSSVAGGLAIDGVPYRHVERLAISPAYATDGTLFAFAWGPREPRPYTGESAARAWRAALFRTSDRGVSWTPVRTFGGDTSFERASVLVALSPSFATDRVALLAVNSTGPTPASAGCSLLRTADGGASWAEVLGRGSYEGCTDLRLVAGPRGLAALVYKGRAWQRSADGGITWEPLAPPEGAAVAVVPSPAYARDETLFVGSSAGGVWTLGPAVSY